MVVVVEVVVVVTKTVVAVVTVAVVVMSQMKWHQPIGWTDMWHYQVIFTLKYISHVDIHTVHSPFNNPPPMGPEECQINENATSQNDYF